MLDPTIRWTDRLQSSSGDWSGNVFDFFFRVNSKIAKDIKKPFKLEGITRVDDTQFIRQFERLWSFAWLIQIISYLVE